ncbi:MFS general substrate transporter [Xylona heveae TC161]|uniref:MFS general substrate transporter n=1 Tax=Xylona heveae (strain CBS 132557 / TC161) TaxID=1328760 RepID=A0A164Z9Z9_XYLHT|nr:MFS general substrate transporter [Xylona heveae TC161]KZF18858.1 MFS general substrate transporter [Xylona heveae TC161]
MRFQPPRFISRPRANDAAVHQQEQEDLEKKNAPEVSSAAASELNHPVPEEEGVQRIEALTSSWTWRELILTYLAIYLFFFIHDLQQSIVGTCAPYIASALGDHHSLVAAIQIAALIIGGVVSFPIARVLDIWGRLPGFVMLFILTEVGMIMMAGALTIQTYAAAQVFYWIGQNGTSLSLQVFLADTSTLKNRAIVYAFTTSPYIMTQFVGPLAATNFLTKYGPSGIRWGYGTFCIVYPFAAAPVIGTLWYHMRQTEKKGLMPKRESGRTWMESVKHYVIEFDVVGMILICAGFVLFLLPFSLAGDEAGKWNNGSIIAMIVVGGCLLIIFPFYEKFFAPHMLLPWELLKNRNVWSTCIVAGTLFVSFYCWDAYFYSYLQVVFQQTIQNASYISSTYTVGSCFVAFIVGALIHVSNYFKWIALFAIPLQILGTGLMIHFRQPDQHIGYVVMCQIFIAFSGGAMSLLDEISVMAGTSHDKVAIVLALLNVATQVGGAIGLSISGAIWTNSMPEALMKFLPADAQKDFASIYGSITTQLSYPMGSPVRVAIIKSYALAQRRMTIAATCVLVLALFGVLMWRNINISRVHQTKGTVF